MIKAIQRVKDAYRVLTGKHVLLSSLEASVKELTVRKDPKGIYHTVKVTKTIYKGGNIEYEFSVYVHGYSHNSGKTPEEALKSLHNEMFPSEKQQPIEEVSI